MLNRIKLAKEFSIIRSQLFPDRRAESDLAKKIWHDISNDDLFSERVVVSKSSFLVPGWKGNLTDSFDVDSSLKNYSVLAIDGSQVYPDRNMPGSGCFLINVGGVFIEYGEQGKANLFSQPYLFLTESFVSKDGENIFSKDLVDLKREEFELKIAFEKCFENKFSDHQEDHPRVCLFDGSLVFWHLEGKAQDTRKSFLDLYFASLDKFYQRKILMAGYISYPKSKELVNLIKLGLCRFSVADCISCHKQFDTFPCRQVDSLLDTHVARFFLKKNQRTTLFWSNSKIVEKYPSHLKPYFFYLDVGDEIARIEIPAWIAENDSYVDTICRVALDQSKKGMGYPVCLAESHEQAVVKGADREFFYHLIFKEGFENKKQLFMSQKSIKKKGIGI